MEHNNSIFESSVPLETTPKNCCIVHQFDRSSLLLCHNATLDVVGDRIPQTKPIRQHASYARDLCVNVLILKPVVAPLEAFHDLVLMEGQKQMAQRCESCAEKMEMVI